jgi:hypothetical protein
VVEAVELVVLEQAESLGRNSYQFLEPVHLPHLQMWVVLEAAFEAIDLLREPEVQI